MRISDERREVAERLRRLDVSITSRDTLEGAVDKFMTAVYGGQPFSPVSYSVRNLCGLGYALVDLIDPTCHVVGTISMDWSDGSTVYIHKMSCGHTRETSLPEPPEYCDECGARLVSDDD